MHEPRHPAWDHQRRALAASLGKPAFAYLMEMGTGKTKVVIDRIALEWQEGKLDRVLIIAPKGVHRNWTESEIPEHMADSLREETLIHCWLGGNSKTEKKALEEFQDGPLQLRILSMNVEAFSMSKTAYGVAEQFVRGGRCLIVVDESTRIKSPTADRTKKIVALGKLGTARAIMSGLPNPRSPLDLYSQFDFLGNRLLGHTSFYSFRAEFAILEEKEIGGRKIKIPVGYRNLERLKSRMSHVSFRVLKEECLDLPPKVYMPLRYVEMTDEQQHVYSEIRDTALAELKDGSLVSAMVVIAQMMKLHQVCTGFVNDEHGVAHQLACNRPQVMADMLEEFEGQAIVWGAYRENMRTIVAKLREGYSAEDISEYHGGVSPEQRLINLQRFQSGRSRFFVGTQAAGGIGLTLNTARMVLYYSSNYDLEQRLQSEDRAHRGDMSHSVGYEDLVCRGTVEEKIVKSLRKKMDIAALVLGERAREWII
jgi:SNF2 family DNA or RNA helicase